MSNYTIKSGDKLWNIVKQQLGLTNNDEISNKVKEVAQNNNISNPNLIFEGKILVVDGSDLGLAVEKQDEEVEPYSLLTSNPNTKKTKTQAHSAAEERIKKLKNMSTFEDLEAFTNSSYKIFDAQKATDAEKEQSYLDYSSVLLKKYYDKNGDGKVTVEEFAERETEDSKKTMIIEMEHLDDVHRTLISDVQALVELYDKDGDGKISEDESKTEGLSPELILAAEHTGSLFAQNLDFNNNGFIDAEELAFFNRAADVLDGEYDGIIRSSAESAMFGSVTGLNAGNHEYKRVVNKYLSGQELTADEEKTLKECQKTIKHNIGKAAGLTSEN